MVDSYDFLIDFIQLHSILKCEHIVLAFKDTETLCEVIHNKFGLIEHMHAVLKPLYQATVVLQSTTFTLSDFYATWVHLENKLQKILQKNNNDSLVSSLLHCLKKRKPQLINNKSMLCAISLDPRFCGELDSHQQAQAIDALLDLWRRIQMIQGNEVVISESSESEDEISIVNTTILSQFKHKQKQSENVFSTNVFSLSEKISSFMSTNHEMPEGTIYDFWIQHEHIFPEIFHLSQLVLSICPTQAIVERAFSTLSYLFPSRRNRLNEDLLNDILIISLNEDLFKLVNEEDRNIIRNENVCAE